MRKGMMKGSGKRGYHNIIGKDPKVHSDSARGRKQPQKFPASIRVKYPFIAKAINQDIKSYKKIYVIGSNNYLLDDYGNKGLLKGYERLPGSDQQRIEIGGKILYDSLKEPKITEKRLREILSKALDFSKLKKDIDKTEYTISFRYIGENEDASIHHLRFTDKEKFDKQIKDILKYGSLDKDDKDKIDIKTLDLEKDYTDRRNLDRITKKL